MNTSGVTGPSHGRVELATTSRASSTVEMNGISVRSKRTSGNWISRALPIVSALMPVLSDRKKTGTTGTSPPSGSPCSPDGAGASVMATRVRRRRSRQDDIRVGEGATRPARPAAPTGVRGRLPGWRGQRMRCWRRAITTRAISTTTSGAQAGQAQRPEDEAD